MFKRSFIVHQTQPGFYSIECQCLKFKPIDDTTIFGALWYFLAPTELKLHRDCSVDIYEFMRASANAIDYLHHDWKSIRQRVIEHAANQETREYLEEFLHV